MYKRDRSVFDSLAKLYQFLSEKYSEELKKSSKNKKSRKINSNILSGQQQNNEALVTAEMIYSFNENNKETTKTEVKEYNINTMKLQTRKKNKDQNPPIDYNPIPFNFLSTKYKYENTQVDPINEEIFLNEIQNYSGTLRENYELVRYLANNKIKSDVFSIWTKKFYYSVLKKKSIKFNNFYFEENRKTLDQSKQFQANYVSDKYNYGQQPNFLFDSCESKSEGEEEVKKSIKPSLQDKNIYQKKKNNSDKVSKSSKDGKDLCVDIVLSEYT